MPMTEPKKGLRIAGTLAVALLVAACDAGGPGDSALSPEAMRGDPAAAVDMRLVGMHALQGRPSYQPVVRHWRGRHLLFAGHHRGDMPNPETGGVEANGFSILDVSDPEAPEFIVHVPATGEGISDTRHLQVCAGGELPQGDPERLYLLRTNGNVSHEIWDVSEPGAAARVASFAETGRTVGGRQETHKGWWDCASGIGYLVGTLDGWRVSRVLQVYDLSDPAEPAFIRSFGLPGTEPGSGEEDLPATGVHQPLAHGDRVYVGYGAGTWGVTQILDRDRLLQGDPEAADPFAPIPENLSYPVIARLDMPTYWGSHTAKPILGLEIADYADSSKGRVRDFLVTISESTNEWCQETPHAIFFLDITEEDRPYPVSSYQVSEAEGDYCARGGRFGPHSIQDSFEPLFHGKLVLATYFNAGVRAIDIRDPFHPVEVARFLPEITGTTMPTCGEIDGAEKCATVIQSNNLTVDERGYIYVLDRAGTGLHILELTGAARAIIGLPPLEENRP